MKTTKHHFKVFREECEKWLTLFNLNDWKCYYNHDKTEVNENAVILFSSNDGKTATLTLGLKHESQDATDNSIRRSAFHEICHLLLADIDNAATRRYTTQLELDAAIHAAINRLEHFVFDKGCKK